MEAQTAVAQALTVLKEFYEKAAEATALLQGKQKPEVFDEPYTGMQSENGGVVGMLEVIQSDFARLETDTKAAEAEAQKAFDEFTSESAVTPSRQVGLDGLIRHSSTLRVTMTEPGNSPSASRSALLRVSMTRAPSAIARARSWAARGRGAPSRRQETRRPSWSQAARRRG